MSIRCWLGLHDKATQWDGSWDDYCAFQVESWQSRYKDDAIKPPPPPPRRFLPYPLDRADGIRVISVRLWWCTRCDAFGKDFETQKTKRKAREHFENEVAELVERTRDA